MPLGFFKGRTNVGGGGGGSQNSSKDATGDDDASSVSSSTSTLTSRSSDRCKQKNGSKKREKRPERRDSGRFTSAAKLLRNLSRAPRNDSSTTSLNRSNPNYHSEGKGLKKKNAWASERELSSTSASNKERSHSFCDKADSKRRYSTQEDPNTNSTAAPDLRSTTLPCNAPHQTRGDSTALPDYISTGPMDRNSDRLGERDGKERRSIRKLTKDSGYETSPYSELSDYAHLDQLVSETAGLQAASAEDSDDDVTLAADSEPTSDVSPSSSPVASTPTLSRVNSREKSKTYTSVYNSPDELSSDPLNNPRTPTHGAALPITAASRTDFSGNPSDGSAFDETESQRNPVLRHPSLSSLANFADSLVATSGASQHSINRLSPEEHQPENSDQEYTVLPEAASCGLEPASSQSSLTQDEQGPPRPPLPAKKSALSSGSSLTRSTPNLDEGKHGSMVTKTLPMYSYLHNGSSHTPRNNSSSSKMTSGRYWEGGGQPDTPGREDYAHHLRSSSYQVLHSQQQQQQFSSAPSSSTYHTRQHSNPSTYPEADDRNSRLDPRQIASNYSSQYYGCDRSRYFSYDSIGPENGSQKYPNSWNVSEPDLSVSNSHPSQNYLYHSSSHNSYSSYSSPDHQSNRKNSSPSLNKSVNRSSSSSFHSSTASGSYHSQVQPPLPSSTAKNTSSPPPPPVRDASSLKYIKYGPGHEKFPSWPVPAGSASQVMNSCSDHENSSQNISESITGPQGSHRSKSWTEQSDYPKDTSGGYTRPHHKKQLTAAYQQQLKTVMEKCERIPPQVFESKLGDDLMSNPNCSLIDSFYPSNSSYYPLYDRDGNGIDDKDYNIPSPPERDSGPGLGEPNVSQLTAAQLEEYARHYDYSCTEMMGVTPFLDRLREESAGWEGASERDSGRGESESMTDSFRYSNGRESVTTVVTNSSSASSSETLKWHGSLSDISLISGHSRDIRAEQNIAHSSRVMAPQRHNSESVLYYGSEKSKKSMKTSVDHRGNSSNKIMRDSETGFPRASRDRWNREVERNNEVNNLKKFPSYSYSQPLSQINEAPAAESHENNSSLQAKSPTIDVSKPPSVAERINELERQSRNPVREPLQRYRDASEPRERTESRSTRELRRRDMSEPRKEYRDEIESETDNDQNNYPDLGYSTPDPDRLQKEVGHESVPDSTLENVSVDLLKDVVPYRTNSMSARVERSMSDQENIPVSNISTLEVDRTAPLKNFAYLDPKKQCKVPEPTLKNIQKQALMSFYVRKTSSSSLSEHGSPFGKPPAPLVSKNSFSSRGHVREDRSGLAGISLARLGRVPDSSDKDFPSRPPRKRSVNGRSDLDEHSARRESLETERSRSGSEAGGNNSSAQNGVTARSSSPDPAPVVPHLPADASLQEDAANLRSTAASRKPALPPTAFEDLPRPPERPPKKPTLRPHFPASPKDATSPSSFGSDDASKCGRPYYYRRPPAPDPPSSEGAGLVTEPSTSQCDSLSNEDVPNSKYMHSLHRIPGRNFSHPVNLSPCPSSLPNFSQHQQCNSAAPLSPTIRSFALQTSRSSTPELPPPPPLQQSELEVTGLPDEEPLPPPPSEISRSSSKICGPKTASETGSFDCPINFDGSSDPRLHDNLELNNLDSSESTLNPMHADYDHSLPKTPPILMCKRDSSEDCDNSKLETYHKDSYMAQKKDWSSGFEGRYRRTSSPSASPSRNIQTGNSITPNALEHSLTHHSSTKCLSTYNNNYAALSSSPMLSSSTMALSYPSNASSGSSSLSSSLSSSSSKSKSGSYLKHSASSTSSSSNSSAGSSSAGPRKPIFKSHIKPTTLDNENQVNNNDSGWAGHARQTSTIVDFTSEALRALRPNKKSEAAYYQPTPIRTLPSAVSTPALLQQATYRSQSASSNQGSSSSLASAHLDPPPKTSPDSSLRASLDSLHCARLPIGSRSRGALDGLPRTVSVNETLSNESSNRCASVVESLSRSTSVADSLCRRSSSAADTPSSLSRASSISESSAPSPTCVGLASTAVEGAVIARPATVTEESSVLQPSTVEQKICHERIEDASREYNGSGNLIDSPTTSLSNYYSTGNSPVPSSNSVLSSPPRTPPAVTELPNDSLVAGSTHSLPSISDDNDSSSQPSSPLLAPSELLLPEAAPSVCSEPGSTDVTDVQVDMVTIGYGRGRRREEVECELLSMEYVSRLGLDPRLQALLAPGPELKTTADYMAGVFKYEVRRDILASRSQHLVPLYENQDGQKHPQNFASGRLSSNNYPLLNGDSTRDSRVKEYEVSPPKLNSASSQSYTNLSSTSNRFSKNYFSPPSEESVSSLTNSNSYSNLNSPTRNSSFSANNSSANLSSANQVANFTSLSSPVRSSDSKFIYSSGRTQSSPEHTTNLSLSINDATGYQSPGACSTDEPKVPINARSPLPSDSAYFTSESKARLLTRMRSSPDEREKDARNSPTSPTTADSQALMQKKEELMQSIGRKLEILRAEEEAIKEEMRLNNELGLEVSQRVEIQAKPQEVEKFKLHVNEIDKITSLLLGLSGRLARAENALLLLSPQDGPELRRVLELKRDRLHEQLQEALVLKENIDRRAAQVDKCLMQYLNEAEFADYDHFSKMKAKLVMDAREIGDKITLGEEQMTALRGTFKSSEEAPFSNGC
ncbi:uncharacterized protein LOC108666958 isoform X2 [Hyalella azteca]|uniref:Uncharacterized protein LOC108666958 isoform X2 n=1 Tax=Hyalella azteca TaxID=294128 RepID=A0A979FVY1_HYAAZ|nr:uncharacterized protein LOC108666958 isoform X2 [Hyalella azteca]